MLNALIFSAFCIFLYQCVVWETYVFLIAEVEIRTWHQYHWSKDNNEPPQMCCIALVLFQTFWRSMDTTNLVPNTNMNYSSNPTQSFCHELNMIQKSVVENNKFSCWWSWGRLRYHAWVNKCVKNPVKPHAVLRWNDLFIRGFRCSWWSPCPLEQSNSP